MWRWSWCTPIPVRLELIFSTYVEVILGFRLTRLRAIHFLHVCGGDPQISAKNYNVNRFSPRMWRWSCDRFSTAGIDNDFLHVCGGDPNKSQLTPSNTRFSPRMWRWSWTTKTASEIFSNFLHVCGGDPKKVTEKLHQALFSPRMWRWSSDTRRQWRL